MKAIKKKRKKRGLLKGLAVIWLSVVNSAKFAYGDQRCVNEAEKVVLESNYVLIFGGETRRISHWVTSIIPNIVPPFGTCKTSTSSSQPYFQKILVIVEHVLHVILKCFIGAIKIRFKDVSI